MDSSISCARAVGASRRCWSKANTGGAVRITTSPSLKVRGVGLSSLTRTAFAQQSDRDRSTMPMVHFLREWSRAKGAMVRGGPPISSTRSESSWSVCLSPILFIKKGLMIQQLKGSHVALCPACRWRGPQRKYNERIWSCSHRGVELVEREDGRLSTDTTTETKLPGPRI